MKSRSTKPAKMSHGGCYFSEEVPEVVVKSIFTKYDTDGSGSLQKDELMILLQQDLGMDAKQAETVMMVVDKDGSGDVSFEEFLQFLRNKKDVLKSVDNSSKYGQLRKAVECFKKFDEDGSGTIEPDELKQLLQAVGYEGSIESAQKKLDKDGDGKISFPEFLEFYSTEVNVPK